MFLNSLIEELCAKEENNKVGLTLTFGGQRIKILFEICCKIKKYAKYSVIANIFKNALLKNVRTKIIT